jgi:hypothetical protein
MANGMARESLSWLAVVKSRESLFITNCVAKQEYRANSYSLLILFYNMRLLKI